MTVRTGYVFGRGRIGVRCAKTKTRVTRESVCILWLGQGQNLIQ